MKQRNPSAPGSAGRIGAATRAAALALLSSVLDQRKPLDSLLSNDEPGSPFAGLSSRDRAFARAMTGTTLRRLGEIERALDGAMERPPKDRKLVRILQLAVAQILFMDVGDHAAVSLAVDQVAANRRTRAFKGLANAVLRRVGREKADILGRPDAARVNTPPWLWQRWTRTYGEEAASRIAAAHLVEPYLDLSVNGASDTLAEDLGATRLATGSLRLVPSGPIESLAGFADGNWWVQDAAAALPAQLLGDVRGLRIGDLCAAPGGKTAQLAALGARVTAVDISPNRLARVSANLDRLHLKADIVVADALTWRPPEPLDAILLDAPCSSTGTIRRHPDVARLKQASDIAKLATLQARLIDHAAELLKPGGLLVYSTCSLEPEEGEDHLAGAASRNGLEFVPVTADELSGPDGWREAVTPGGTIRTLPSQLPGSTPRMSGLDGFFAMRLREPGPIAHRTSSGDSPQE